MFTEAGAAVFTGLANSMAGTHLLFWVLPEHLFPRSRRCLWRPTRQLLRPQQVLDAAAIQGTKDSQYQDAYHCGGQLTETAGQAGEGETPVYLLLGHGASRAACQKCLPSPSGPAQGPAQGIV